MFYYSCVTEKPSHHHSIKKKKEAETQESKVGMDTLAFVKSRKSGFPVSLFRFSLVEVKNEISCFTEDVVFIFFFLSVREKIE